MKTLYFESDQRKEAVYAHFLLKEAGYKCSLDIDEYGRSIICIK